MLVTFNSLTFCFQIFKIYVWWTEQRQNSRGTLVSFCWYVVLNNDLQRPFSNSIWCKLQYSEFVLLSELTLNVSFDSHLLFGCMALPFAASYLITLSNDGFYISFDVRLHINFNFKWYFEKPACLEVQDTSLPNGWVPVFCTGIS